jgi:[NiFe] hydrogenase diaphorase moiety large subunit
MSNAIANIIERYGSDPTRLMDILIDIQSDKGCISRGAIEQIASALGLAEVDVEQTVSFYHFLGAQPRGRYTIYLNNSIVSEMMGRDKVAAAFEQTAGCRFGEVSPDGSVGLFNTACIGMNDQEPAAIINSVIFPRLTAYRAREIVNGLRDGQSLEQLQVEGFGEGKNYSDRLKTTVRNNIMKKGPVIFSDYEPGSALRKAAGMTPGQVIAEMKESGMRGRGGAGFPTGLKWEFCRKTAADQRFIFCNADEGEPGTFKDRVILTEYPRLVCEGMALAGYAVGATRGILYVRYEYRYLRDHLEGVLAELRSNNLLGNSIAGKKGFDFDIRIQFGAGAYVCGEESALIESAEGKRGEPRDRPPFPVEKGYLQKPTVVNNVETLCSAVKVLLHGGRWYKKLGTPQSSGTKVLSVSGDCRLPGIYEIEWGFSVNDILAMAGAEDVQAVQVGGPSGACIAPDEFDRVLAYEDLATGGSLIVFNQSRDLLREAVINFMDFFIDESCGSCAPCRINTVMMRDKLQKILHGHGTGKDIDDLQSWGRIMPVNRCGLGQTAPNPILSTLRNFPHLYGKLTRRETDFDTEFDLAAAVRESCEAAGRIPNL